MYRSAIFQVTYHGDGQVFERALRLVDRVKIKHRLRRMLVGSVAGIDHRGIGNLGGVTGRPLEIMAHYNQVHIVAHHLDSILKGLPLGGTGS